MLLNKNERYRFLPYLSQFPIQQLEQGCIKQPVLMH